MTAEVRAARPGEAAALEQLELEAFPHDPWKFASIQQAVTDPRYLVLVCVVAGQIHGYLLGWHVGEDADIARLGVAMARRRSGLATLLMESALREWTAQGVERVFLDVRAANTAAIGLYQALGFQRDGLRRSYYPDGEDAVLMSLNLARDHGERSNS